LAKFRLGCGTTKDIFSIFEQWLLIAWSLLTPEDSSSNPIFKKHSAEFEIHHTAWPSFKSITGQTFKVKNRSFKD